MFAEKVKPNGTIEEGLNDKIFNLFELKVVGMLKSMKMVHIKKMVDGEKGGGS